MDKKAADEYDKMLDMADSLSVMFEQAPVELSESIREELCVYLAQNRDEVLIALQAKKAKAVSQKKLPKSEETAKNSELSNVAASNESGTTAEKTKKVKTASAKAANKAKSAVA